LGSGEFVAVAVALAEGEAEALGDAVSEALAEAVVASGVAEEEDAEASDEAFEPQAASRATELTPSTPNAARRVRISDIVIPFRHSVIATSLTANAPQYRVQTGPKTGPREKHLVRQARNRKPAGGTNKQEQAAIRAFELSTD